LGAKDDVDPNPPLDEGADHGLEPLDAANPPKRGFEGVLSFVSSLFAEVSVLAVNDPKILAVVSVRVLATLDAASLTASRGVAASTWVGVAAALVFSWTAKVSFVVSDMMARELDS
jgi:hypothetical protein